MMVRHYPFKLNQIEDGYFTAESVDIPECITQGENIGDALYSAREALLTAFQFYDEIPKPSKAASDQYLVSVEI